MAQLLTVSRAAQIVGAPRGVLQRMIRGGELASFDGMIALDDLMRAFPDARVDDAGAFEKVSRIREEAFGRRMVDRVLPSQEVLAQRLLAQVQENTELRRHLQAYHELVDRTLDMLGSGTRADPDDVRRFLEGGLARVLATEAAGPIEAMNDMLKAVSANVVVKPSGREYLVEGNDSLLQAGLKAGLGFAYGCGGGNCGLCKARLVSGETRQVMHSDYRLSAAEQQQGYLLLCAHTAVSDVVIETLEASGPADIPVQEVPAKVRSVTPLAGDTMLLHLQTPRSSRLRFLAGQSVALGAASDAGDVQGTYPLASCPCDDRNLLFHVARSGSDPFAEELFAGRIGTGAQVAVRGPFGDFVLGQDTGRPLVFLVCDTGFAPVRSLIEHAIASEAAESFGLWWLSTRPDGHYQSGQCRAWADAFDGFLYDAVADPDPRAGAAKLAALAARERSLAEADVFVAGPAAFVEAAAAELERGPARPRRIATAVV